MRYICKEEGDISIKAINPDSIVRITIKGHNAIFSFNEINDFFMVDLLQKQQINMIYPNLKAKFHKCLNYGVLIYCITDKENKDSLMK